ncbi:MAG TPA: hypothetical protein ENK60_07070 [Anaerolineae bacterium]|nr:hypothetical protein [Anaerolineae bacterium]
MLHTDAGEADKFEFPGPDAPVKVGDKIITPAFNIDGDIKVGQIEGLGDILVDRNGMTLYVFLKDQPGKSNCYGQCAENWPPLLVEGEPVAGPGVDANLLGVTMREDGSMQATYNNYPLYYFYKDESPGDATGQGVGAVWYVIGPDGNLITK